MRIRVAFLILSVASAVLEAQASLTPAQMREELQWFRRAVFSVEQSYTPATRSEAERRLVALERALDRTTALAFEMEIARIVALADNGHSAVNALGRTRRSNRVPLRLTTFGDEFRVMRAGAGQGDLLGARLVAIDGHPIVAVRDSGRTLWGGTPAWRDRSLPLFLESPAQLHVLGIARDDTAAEYSFVTRDGRRVVRRLVAGPADAGGLMQPGFHVYAEPAPDAGWVRLMPAALPWSLQEPMRAFRWRAVPEINALVVQMRRVVDGPGQPIMAFLDDMTARLRADRPTNLVLDMRMNTGGDLNNAREFMKSLPSLVPGRIFVLTSATTFSAAISSVGYLEQAGAERVTIVGEEVGDRLVFFAEGRPATAPHSGIAVGRSTERHDYRGGCRAFTDCHGPVVRNPIAVATLAPDIAAPLTFADWEAGRDPGFAAVMAALRSRGGGP